MLAGCARSAAEVARLRHYFVTALIQSDVRPEEINAPSDWAAFWLAWDQGPIEAPLTSADDTFQAAAQGANASMVEPVSFFSKCPKCGHPRLQNAYVQRGLVRLLDIGQPIYAYCLICDVQWPITLQERHILARGIPGMQRRTAPSSSDVPPQRRSPSR